MQRLICMLCHSVKSNTSTLRMQLEIKCRDLSVRSANQWKATHTPWGCNSRSNAETYLDKGGRQWRHLIGHVIFQLMINWNCRHIKKASQDKEEVFEGGWSGIPTPSTTAIKNLFFIMWSFLYKLKVGRSLVEEKQRWGQHLLPLPHNKLCCQIWAKEGDHEGDH